MTTMKEMFKFNCGDEVKEKISGAAGIITCRAEALSGNIKYAVRPKEAKDGKPADSFWQDEGGLVLKKKSTSVPPTREFQYQCGDQVKDKYTDVTGTIVFRCDHIHQCITYEVQPRELTKEGDPAKSTNLDEKAIVLVKSAMPAVTKSGEVPLKRTGAESLSSPRNATPRIRR
jgi:hypothetical protein